MKRNLIFLVIFLACGSCYSQNKGTIKQKPTIVTQDFDPQNIIVKGIVVSILAADPLQKQYPLNKYPSKAIIKILSIGRKGRTYNGDLPSKINQDITMFFPMTTQATRTIFNKSELKTKALFKGLTVGQKITAEVSDTQEALDEASIPRVITYQE